MMNECTRSVLTPPIIPDTILAAYFHLQIIEMSRENSNKVISECGKHFIPKKEMFHFINEQTL